MKAYDNQCPRCSGSGAEAAKWGDDIPPDDCDQCHGTGASPDGLRWLAWLDEAETTQADRPHPGLCCLVCKKPITHNDTVRWHEPRQEGAHKKCVTY